MNAGDTGRAELAVGGPTDPLCRAGRHPLTPSDRAAGHCLVCLTDEGWQLGEDAPTGPLRGRLYRWRRRRAFQGSLAAFVAGRDDVDAGRWRLTVISGVLALLDLAVLLLGLDLIIFSRNLLIAVGLVLVLVAVELRPRRHRPPRQASEIAPDASPALRALLAELGASSETPVDVLVGAAATIDGGGSRGRAYVLIGARGWDALSDDARLAALARGLAHTATGDPDRRRATDPARKGFGRAADLIDPQMLFPPGDSPLEPLRALARGCAWPVLGVLARLLQAAQIVSTSAALPANHAYAYRLDETTARRVGRDAVLAMLTAIRADASEADTIRAADLVSADPPIGLRARRVRDRPTEPTEITDLAGLRGALNAVNAELAPHFERATQRAEAAAAATKPRRVEGRSRPRQRY
jgi:hypothetical protein